ncbi:hypothetical protein ILYODFUR_037677 [Ilyodon furcidens]|uniref:Secreted protein n=1 Tax=Ilyodon furcidens TaxID=33524 RepID=A0ABV0UC40_9TELE
MQMRTLYLLLFLHGASVSFSVLTVVYRCSLFALKGTLSSSGSSTVLVPCCVAPTVDASWCVAKAGRNVRRCSTEHQSSKAPEPNWVKNEKSFGGTTTNDLPSTFYLLPKNNHSGLFL